MLLSSEHPAIRHFTGRDLLLEDPGPVDTLWTLPSAQGTLRKQQEDGLWKASYEQIKRAQPTPKERETMLWVNLAICRAFQRLGTWQPHPRQSHTDA